MKKSLMIIAAAVAMMVSWNACNQVEETGKVQFGLELEEDSELKSAVEDRDIAEALVSIVGENGQILFDKEPIKVYTFGGGFVTESLKIPVGEYALTEFMLVNSAGEVVWATPKQGSPLAHLVRHPLPMHFGISPEQTTNLDVQVIRVGQYTPDDFGYVSFDIGFVNRFCLSVYYASRCMDYWDDRIMSPDGSVAPYHQPMLTIYAGDRVILKEPMNPGLNHYQLPIINSGYFFTATDCRGMVFYERMFSLDELTKHRCQDGYPPLVIHHLSDPGIIITPEGLYEPTIKQGVFGGVVLPIDEPMPAGTTNSTDIWPVIRDIYFFPYAVMDSIYTFAPVDCYFPWDLINMDPVAIVRTNSDGIFQVPLEAGPYLYLVRDEHGYYVDAYISSHKPGFVMVYPEEVTELWINVVDCSLWQ
jgi:hypothetical protein